MVLQLSSFFKQLSAQHCGEGMTRCIKQTQRVCDKFLIAYGNFSIRDYSSLQAPVILLRIPVDIFNAQEHPVLR